MVCPEWHEWGKAPLICRGQNGDGPVFGIICDCGHFVPFVSEEGIDECACGAKYRLIIQYALPLPLGTRRGRKKTLAEAA